jgi:hypothetical protein
MKTAIKISVVVLAACVLSLSMTAETIAADPERSVPIMIGGNEELDACGGWAEVSGLNPKGDGFLAVRSGPGTRYGMRDKLREGDGVYLCDGRAGSKWVAIVYPKPGQNTSECKVSSPIARRIDYRGPCRFGWVHGDWIKLIAG